MKQTKVKSTIRIIAIICIMCIIDCTAVTVTTVNTTTPVLVGPVKKIKGKATTASEGKEFDFDHAANAFYFIMGDGNGGTQKDTSVRIISSNEFDGELMIQLDTTKEHAEVKQINVGSYSMLDILLGAFHKTWAGIEGKIVKKENLK